MVPHRVEGSPERILRPRPVKPQVPSHLRAQEDYGFHLLPDPTVSGISR